MQHRATLLAAFAGLGDQDRVIFERLLFAGDRCSEIAEALSIAIEEVRAAALRAMRQLRHRSASDDCEGLLALYALRLLDPGEAEAARRAIAASATLRRRYLEERDLVVAVSELWPQEPPAHLFARLMSSVAAR